MSDIETRLRATLAEQAARAPAGDVLALRILAEVDTPARVLRSPRGRNGRGWNTWTMPLLAAGAVAAVVATVVGVGQLRHTASPQPPAVSHVAPAPSPSPSPAVSNARPQPTSRTASPSKAVVAPAGATVTGFRALDLSFVSANDGWAIGPADCVTGAAATCTALFHTTDGTIWQSMPGASFNLPGVKDCAAPCVDHIRFANQRVGYAYSADVLFMTIDDGFHWTAQPGRGADALETLDGNVIRLVSDSTGCPGPCNVRVETAPLGGSNWTTVHLRSGDVSAAGVQLTRSGSAAYVLATGHTAGGAGSATSTLYVSSDDGASWQPHGEPCPRSVTNRVANKVDTTNEVDSTAVAAAPGSALSVLCAPRDGTSPAFLALSHDQGTSFVRAHGAVAADLLAGDPSTVLIAAANAAAYRSADAGATWARIADVTGSIHFLGFESPTVGRIVANGGRTIWTTRDGGATWLPISFTP